MITLESEAITVAVEMGMGHIRAAHPLRNISVGGIWLYGSKTTVSRDEYEIWNKIRSSYYAVSRAARKPLIGAFLGRLLERLQRIEPYYPRRDLSRPNFAVTYLDILIRRKGLCRELVTRIKNDNLPIIHTYFATAMAADRVLGGKAQNYLVICDSDFNRVWAPKDPLKSNLNYLAPCVQAKRRLLSYGVREENIFLTGFPLPPENIGGETGLEILKNDLRNRLLRLDPRGRFFHIHGKAVKDRINGEAAPSAHDRGFTVTFALGGAGAQTELAFLILESLQRRIQKGQVRLTLSVGIMGKIFQAVMRKVKRMGLNGLLGNGFDILFDTDPFVFLDKFNACLRQTDVLWTKPSELVFYSGLGIPIIMAPPIGSHEECNKRWLQEVQAGVNEAGPIKFCDEWLFDLRDNGILAQAAWNGFLNVRNTGTFNIERLVHRGIFQDNDHRQNP